MRSLRYIFNSKCALVALISLIGIESSATAQALPIQDIKPAFTAETPPDSREAGNDAQSALVKARLQERYPATSFTRVTPAPLPGLFEVVMGNNIAYTDATGKYFLFGHVFDMESRQDLTALALGEQPTPIKRVNWEDLPLEDAIKFGSGSKKLAVFSDPDCPFCKRIEPELAKLPDTMVYLFAFPIEQLHPNAVEISKQIWCSTDQAGAWRNYVLKGQLPVTKATTCVTPIDRISELAERLGINSTPTLISGDGRIVSGAASAGEITQWLSENNDSEGTLK